MPKTEDDYAELGAPVADMVLAKNTFFWVVDVNFRVIWISVIWIRLEIPAVFVVVPEFEDAGDNVADDGGAQMADVHLFGDIGAGKIDHGNRWIFLGIDAEAGLVLEGIGETVGKPIGSEAKVNKTGPGDFGWFAHIRNVEFFYDLSG